MQSSGVGGVMPGQGAALKSSAPLPDSARRPQPGATNGAAVKRASVVECSSPLELWPKTNLANQRANGFSPGAAIGGRLTARAEIQPERTNHGGLG